MDFDSYSDLKMLPGWSASGGRVCAFLSNFNLLDAERATMDCSGLVDAVVFGQLDITNPVAVILKLESSDDAVTWIDCPADDFYGRDPSLVGDGLLCAALSEFSSHPFELRVGLNLRSRYYRFAEVSGWSSNFFASWGIIGVHRHGPVPDEV